MSSPIITIGKENRPLIASHDDSPYPKDTLIPPRPPTKAIMAQPLTPTKDYFTSPVTTLSRSVTSPRNISRMDVVEAYCSINDRFRVEINDVLDNTHRHKFVALLHTHSGDVFAAIQRDMRIFMAKPLLDPSVSREEALRVLSDHFSLPLSAATLLSNILRFPILYSQIRAHHIDQLMKSVFVVLKEENLPQAGRERTWKALIFLLGRQRLPVQESTSYISKSVKFLQEGLADEEAPEELRLVCLRAVSNLLTAHQIDAMAPLYRALPEVFSLLMHTSLKLRQEAGRTLVSYALVKLAHPAMESFLVDHIGRGVCNFINENSTKTAGQSQNGKVKVSLNPEEWRKSEKPYWTIPVIAALIVLSDYGVFAHPLNVKVFTSHLAGVYKQKSTHALYYPMWHCLVWAYNAMLRKQTTSSSQAESTQKQTERSFRLVSQQLNGGVGAAILSIILRRNNVDCKPTAQATIEALEILKAMVANDDSSVHQDGVSILTKLVASIGSSADRIDNHFPLPEAYVNRGLFDRALTDATKEDIGRVVEDMHLEQLPNFSWRFSAEETNDNWDLLLDIWKGGIKAHLDLQDSSSSDNLLEIWHSLLLAKAEFTQQKEHFTTNADIDTRLTQALTEIFTLPGFKEPQSQMTIISFVRRLWLTMRNTFSATYLQDSSASLCQALCDARCATEDDSELLKTWLGFSFDLIRSADMSQYNFIGTFRTSFEQSPQVAENLWPVLAEQYRDGSRASAEDLVAFIQASYGRWTLSAQALELWGDHVAQAVASAKNDNGVVQSVLKDEHSVSQYDPKQCLTFFNVVPSIQLTRLPANTLSLISRALVVLYPEGESHDFPPCVLAFLDILGKQLLSQSSFIHLITSLKDGLKIWFTDTKEVLSISEHVQLVENLFRKPLNSLLPTHVPSLQFLEEIGSYCVDVIAHPRTKVPTAANAFERFWDEKYRGVTLDGEYPSSIALCVVILRDIGKYVGDDIPETQLTSQTVIPDSCPPSTPRDRIRQRYFSLTPKSPRQRFTPTTGRRSSNARGASPSETPSKPPLKRPSPAPLDDDRDTKKRKISTQTKEPTKPASPRPRKKLVFEGVIIPSSNSLKRSQLMTPCPSVASLGPSQEVVEDSEEEREEDEDEDEQEEDAWDSEHMHCSQNPLEEDEELRDQDDAWEKLDSSQKPLRDEEEDIVMEMQEEVEADMEVEQAFHDGVGEASYVCPSPPGASRRSHTEPLLRPPPPPPPLRRVQTTPAETDGMDDLRRTGVTFGKRVLTKDELFEAQKIVQDLNNQIFHGMGRYLS
ncbi:hypothetical protein BDZ89DRAFT_1154406 [Hymenopellis radicata]|nr:hypothetical protein BDZ89DRAFT_1154406 [Hymenopellis radicata]